MRALNAWERLGMQPEDLRQTSVNNLRPSCPRCGIVLPESTLICPADGTVIDAGLSVTPASQPEPGSAITPDPSVETGAEIQTQALSALRLSETYQFESVIDTGGMGVVYIARHKLLDKRVAIKMLKPGHFTDAALRRFQREAKTASNVSHPNIVTVHDFGVSERGQPYMVMEFVEGISLAQKIKKEGSLSLAETVNIIRQICDALECAHESGILHRDIKPSNIIIMEGGNVKVVDFGIAKSVDTESPGQLALTETGEALGSPLYMSPEQSLGKKVDSRSDLYSLGCVLFECLAGTPPFLGKTALETMMLRINEGPPTLRAASLGREFPHHVEHVIARLLQRDPGDRFQTAAEVRQALLGAGIQDKITDRTASTSSEGARRATIAIAILITVMAFSAGTWSLLHPPQKMPSAGITTDGAPQKVKEFSVDDLTRTIDTMTLSKEEAIEMINRCSGDSLSLRLTDIGDLDLKLLSDKPNLRSLELSYLHIGDGGLKYLQDLSLQRLDISGTAASDDGLIFIAKMPALRSLRMNAVDGITDAGLPTLAHMKNLKELVIDGKHITVAGLQSLYKQMKDCVIYSKLSEALETKIDQKINDPAALERNIRSVMSELQSLNIPWYHRLYFKASMRLGWALTAQGKDEDARHAFLTAYRNAVERDQEHRNLGWVGERRYSEIREGLEDFLNKSSREEETSDSEKLRRKIDADRGLAAFQVAFSSCQLQNCGMAKQYADIAFQRFNSFNKEQVRGIELQLRALGRNSGGKGLKNEAELSASWLKMLHERTHRLKN